jgi:repressor LexA
MKEKLISRLKMLMEKNNMTAAELSRKSGIRASSISDYLTGKYEPKQDKIDRLAQALNVSPAWLMGYEHKRCIPSNIITPGAIPIPILGEICAGDGIYGEENFKGTFFIDQSVKADYCLIVHGDSMIDAGIYDGDIAFLQKDFELIDGEIYAVVFGAEDSATLKQLYRDGKTVILQPCNKEYKPIIVDYVDLYVVGLLVGVYHKID